MKQRKREGYPQETKRKNPTDPPLPPDAHLQSPNPGDRNHKQHQIRNHIDNTRADKNRKPIYARLPLCLLVRLVHAVQQDRQDEGDAVQ